MESDFAKEYHVDEIMDGRYEPKGAQGPFANVVIKEPKSEVSCCGRVFEKDPEKVVPGVSLSSLLGQLGSKYIRYMVIGTIASALQGASLPVFAIAFGYLFQVLLPWQPGDPPGVVLERAALVSWIFFALGCWNLIFGFIGNGLWSMTGAELGFRLRSAFFSSVLQQEVGYFDDESSGKLIGMLNADIEDVRNATSEKVASFVMFMGQALAGVIVSFVYAPILTLVLLAISPLMAIGAALQMLVVTKGQKSQGEVFREASSLAADVFAGFRTVAAYVWQKEARVRYAEKLDAAINPKTRAYSALFYGMSFFLMFAVFACAMGVGAVFVAEGRIGGDDLLVAFFAVLTGAMGLGQALTLVPDFAKGRGSAVNIVRLFHRIPLVDPNPAGRSASGGALVPSIEYSDVRFKFFNREQEVLKGVSFSVKPGESVGLCGESGAGKSTMVKLLERFYDCTGGQILVGGLDLRDYDLHWLRSQVGIVSQEPMLFNTTIKENILIGKPGATDEEVIAAARSANAHDFISAFPEQYDTMVGEGGGQMSGGQRQRICIARAILKNPPILILDEATASLDNQSEAVVQEALERASAGRTTFAIAHRLSTIKNSDLILVMDKGQIVESGKHWDLMMQKGLYYALQVRQMLPEELRDLEDQMEERKKAQINV